MTRIQLTFLYVFTGLVLFAIFRGLLLWNEHLFFAELSVSQIIFAFIDGMRFDLHIILAAFALPLILLNLPFRFTCNALYHSVFSWIIFLCICIFGLFLVANLLYFPEVNHHIGSELILVTNDIDYIIEQATTTYKIQLFIVLFSLVLLFILWLRTFVKIQIKTDKTVVRSVFNFLFVIIFVAYGYRGIGSLPHKGKPISTIDAFSSANAKQASLTLNGIFTAVRSTISSLKVQKNAGKKGSLAKKIRHHHTNISFVKSYDNLPNRKNLVFIIFESLNSEWIDALEGTQYGITPNLDKIVQQSMCFTNFLSTANRSILGIQAAFTGVPTLPGIPYLGRGLELMDVNRIGITADQYDYQTLFVRSAKRHSYRLDMVTKSLGFEQYYGKEDVQEVLDYPTKNVFGRDYETFMLLYDKINETKKPFMSFIFTSSTHYPGMEVPERFKKYPQNSDLNQFFNSIYYMDWSFGQFMEKARNSSWFENTIFIFTADHHRTVNFDRDFIQNRRIPFVIYSPTHPEQKNITTIASQLDVLPTLYDLLGFPDEVSAFGESLLRKESDFTLLANGTSIVTGVNSTSYVRYSQDKVLDSNDWGGATPSSNADLDLLKQKTLSSIQQVNDKILFNTWLQ